MVRWGVGKNMVDAIKYWAKQANANVVNSNYKQIHDVDPYLESLSSIWLLHWELCKNYTELNSFRVFFSYYNGLQVSKESYLEFMKQLWDKEHFLENAEKGSLVKLPSDGSLKKDIAVLFQTFSKPLQRKASEDSFLSPLTELGLIKPLDRSTFICELEYRHSLSDDVFLFATLEYLSKVFSEPEAASTISFDHFLTSPGSPARVFRLSQSELEQRLSMVEERTAHGVGWTDTQGLRQIQVADKEAFSPVKIQMVLDKILSKARK